MLVKLPTSALHRISSKGEEALPLGESLIAVGIGMGKIGDGEWTTIGLVETAPDAWDIKALEEFDLWSTGDLMADCVTIPGNENLVGYVLPPNPRMRSLNAAVG